MTKKMKKALCLPLVMIVLLGFIACGKQGKGKDELQVASGIPTYADDKQIELAAYCGPRRAGYRFWNGVYGSHPDDPAGGWDGWITEEAFQDYMDCGFTYLLAESDAPYDADAEMQRTVSDFSESSLYEYMELAEKMNIPVVVFANQLVSMTSNADSRLSEEQKDFLSKMVSDLSAYKMFKGFTFRDEPNVKCARTFGAVQNYLTGLKPNSFYFTSLLPIYANDLSLYSTENQDNREKAYMDYVNAFSDATGTFCYDSYPLKLDPIQGATSVSDTWFQNLRLVAENAKGKDYDAGITIQSCAFGTSGAQDTSFHTRAITSKADITFQLYTALAYGYKYVNYFTYWQHWSPQEKEDFYTAMVNYPEQEGEEPIKTDAYYAVKEANAEIKKFDHVFLNFDWEGTMTIAPEGKTPSTGLQLAGDYDAPRISSVTATEEAIIGCLKDADGYDGYMIANATDPGKNQGNSVTIVFRKASKALAYIEGEETEITLQDGQYTFELGAGAGVFVIPIQ